MEPSRKKELGIVIGVIVYTLVAFVLIALVARDPALLASPLALVIGLVAISWVAAVTCAYAALHSWTAGRHIISGVSVLAAAVAGMSWAALVGGLLMSVFIFAAASTIAVSSRERIKFRLKPILLPGIRLLLAGMLLAVVALLLPEVRQQITSGEIFVPADSIAVMLRPVAPLLGNFLPGYTPTSTVDNLIDQQIAQQSASLPPGFEIPPQEKVRARQELSRTVGIPLTGSETLADIMAGYINRYIQGLTQRDGILVTIILIAIGLLAVRAIVPLFAWAALAFAYVIFFIARRSGLVTIVESQVPAEQLRV